MLATGIVEPAPESWYSFRQPSSNCWTWRSVRRSLACRFVDGDRLRQSPGAVVQVAEPHRCRQVVRIQVQGALEARLRKAVLSEHEGRDARAEAQARIVWPSGARLGERLERVAEPPRLDCCRAGASESGGIAAAQGRAAATQDAKKRRVAIESRFDRQTALCARRGPGFGELPDRGARGSQLGGSGCRFYGSVLRFAFGLLGLSVGGVTKVCPTATARRGLGY